MKSKQNFTYTPDKQTYTLQLRKKNLWWLLLFLVPLFSLLLQIHIHKKIIFKTIDKDSQIAMQNAVVNFSYPERNYIDFSSFKFFTKENKNLVQITNKDGIAAFDVSFTIYGKIFHSKDIATVIATGGCFQSDSLHFLFYKLKNKFTNILELSARKQTFAFTVIDAFDKQVLPNADVVINYYLNGQKQEFAGKSDSRGIVIAKIMYCADSMSVKASKFGYKTYKNQGIKEYFAHQQNRILPLKPISSPIELTVKDLYTKRPVPNAKIRLVFENSSIEATTNTNGLGKAMFDSIAINKRMNIQVSHIAYYDTITKSYTVDEFMKLTQAQRIIYIRPKPGNIDFQNIDKLTGEPLEDVNNEVFVNGKKLGDFVSNSFGEFSVPNLNANDKISINATKPGYLPNNFTIDNKRVADLNTKEKRKIPLEPDLKPQNEQPPKKNCRAHFSGTLLSDTYIEGHISTIYKPDKYGEYVGEGDYPSNAIAFPNAVAHTFDAIAVDKGTRVILYSKPNFKGRVLLDVTGPALINNVKWKNERRIKNVNTKTFAGNLQALFPNSCRSWSSENMNNWSNGSVKVICEGNNK